MSWVNIISIRPTIKKALSNPLTRNMLIVGIITLLIKVTAFYKETLIASSFGLGEILDTFLVAILVPTFIQSVFMNSLRNIFIPNYITEMKNNGNKGSFQSIILIITMGISVFSALLAFLTIDFFLEVVYPGHSESYYVLVKNQLYIVLPCLLFWGVNSVMGGLLEISDRYLIAHLYGFIPLITMIFFLFFLKDYFGELVLAFGTLVGTILGFIYMLTTAKRHKVLLISKPIVNANAKLMIRQLPPKISSSFLSAMNNYIDQFFAGQLIVGSIAALNYGNRLPAFGITIVIMALGSVLLPHFSRLVNEDLNAAYRHLFRSMKIVLLGGIVLVTIGIFLSDWLVELWLERNEFTHEDTLKVSAIQQILLVNVPFYLCTLIMVKFLTSINKN
ncbi:MAG: virulence factor MviN, partial [Saprospiraceae bacterium]|nr:virulence factor MviN [Saprospiraceae bacterium]